jgi:hypothetical protein
LTFKAVKSPAYTVSGQQRVDHEVFCDFTWAGSSLEFRLGKSLAGAATSLSLQGTANLAGSTAKFSIPPRALAFDLELSKAVDVQIFGGLVRLPKNTRLRVTNDTAIQVRGKKFTGTLAYSAENLRWKDATLQPPFGFPAMRQDLVSTGTVQFRTTIASAVTHVADGTFVSAGKVVRDIKGQGDGHRAKVRKLSTGPITIHVTESRVEVAVRDVAVDGALVVKSGPTLPLPTFADGSATVEKLRAVLAPTRGTGVLERFDVVTLHYAPRETVAGAHYSKDELDFADALEIPTLTKLQRAAIADGMRTLEATPYFSLFASVPAADLLPAIRTFLADQEEFSDVRDVRISEQLIAAQVALGAGPGAQLPQLAVLNVSPSVVEQDLMLRVSLEFMRPREATVAKATSDTLLQSFAAATSRAESAFSAIVSTIRIPVDLPEVKDVSFAAAGTFKETGKFQLKSDTVSVALKLGASAVLVDPDGAHVLANVTDP